MAHRGDPEFFLNPYEYVLSRFPETTWLAAAASSHMFHTKGVVHIAGYTRGAKIHHEQGLEASAQSHHGDHAIFTDFPSLALARRVDDNEELSLVTEDWHAIGHYDQESRRQYNYDSSFETNRESVVCVFRLPLKDETAPFMCVDGFFPFVFVIPSRYLDQLQPMHPNETPQALRARLPGDWLRMAATSVHDDEAAAAWFPHEATPRN